jgi:hypothetical protein
VGGAPANKGTVMANSVRTDFSFKLSSSIG